MWLLLICLFGLVHVYAQDCNTAKEEHLYNIIKLLQNALEYNDTTLNRLNRIFFGGQDYQENSVDVHYTIYLPMKDSNCTCWNYTDCNSTGNCPDGYCCIEKDFIWDRVPLVGQDEFYRVMNICPFIIGSNSRRNVTIEITNQTVLDQIPCTWCCLDKTSTSYPGKNFFDGIFYIARPESVTLLDHALLVMTERLQGISAKINNLPWLSYPSELVNGYADSHEFINKKHIGLLILEFIVFVLFYFFSNILLFMLTRKYLKPFYIHVKNLRLRNISNVDEKVDSAFLISFVISIVVLVIGVILQAYFGGGICITKPQLVFICIMGIFSFVQLIFVCYKLCFIPCCRRKKRSTGTAQNQHSEPTETHQLTDYTVLQDKVTLKMAEVVDTGVCFKDRNNENVTVDCVIGSDGTASLEANLQYAVQVPPAAFTMESKNKITLKIFGKASENVGITFKDTNDVTCVDSVVGSDGTPANLECTIKCAQDSQQSHFTGCTVLQDMITLKIAGPANKNVHIDISFKNANNEVSTVHVNCVIGSDGTATLKSNFQRPHFTGCTVSSQGEITLEIAGPANKSVDVSFKDTNKHEVSIVNCDIGPNGKATLEGNFKQTHGRNYFKEFPINCHCNSRCCENNCACTYTEKVCTYITKTIILWFLYSLPHVVFYLLMLLAFNFFLNPFGYLVVLEYLTFSVVALWIVNTIFFAMLFTSCNNKRTTPTYKTICKLIFAFLIFLTTNASYLFGWNFINVYFYDNRPQVSDILKLAPLIVTSLLAWYSKDDLLEIFNKILPPVGPSPTTSGSTSRASLHEDEPLLNINQ